MSSVSFSFLENSRSTQSWPRPRSPISPWRWSRWCPCRCIRRGTETGRRWPQSKKSQRLRTLKADNFRRHRDDGLHSKDPFRSKICFNVVIEWGEDQRQNWENSIHAIALFVVVLNAHISRVSWADVPKRRNFVYCAMSQLVKGHFPKVAKPLFNKCNSNHGMCSWRRCGGCR